MEELEMVQVKGKRIYFAFIGDIDEGRSKGFRFRK